MATLDYSDGVKVFGNGNTKVHLEPINGSIRLVREDGVTIELTGALADAIEQAVRGDRFAQARMNA